MDPRVEEAEVVHLEEVVWAVAETEVALEVLVEGEEAWE